MAALSRYPKRQHLGLFNTWCNMRRRCNGTGSELDRKNYIERGITYDARWSSWEAFCDDMALGYKPGLTLDRIDNDKGYSKENCRWATRKEQNNNTRANRWFTINGQAKTLAQWCELSSLSPSHVRQRFYVLNYPIEKALGFDRKIG